MVIATALNYNSCTTLGKGVAMSSLLTPCSCESKEEEALAIQSRTFLYWVNLHLKKKSLSISDLYDDFENGVMLIRLLECLAPDKKISGRSDLSNLEEL